MPTLEESDAADKVAYSKKIEQKHDSDVPEIQMNLSKDIVGLRESQLTVQIAMVLINVFKLSQHFILISPCIHPPCAVIFLSDFYKCFFSNTH